MDNIWTRCSICFDAPFDFCLKGCKDQFCKQCFERYVSELVRNSWGLNVQKVTCPVCQDVLDQHEWQRVNLYIRCIHDWLILTFVMFWEC